MPVLLTGVATRPALSAYYLPTICLLSAHYLPVLLAYSCFYWHYTLPFVAHCVSALQQNTLLPAAVLP